MLCYNDRYSSSIFVFGSKYINLFSKNSSKSQSCVLKFLFLLITTFRIIARGKKEEMKKVKLYFSKLEWVKV